MTRFLLLVVVMFQLIILGNTGIMASHISKTTRNKVEYKVDTIYSTKYDTIEKYKVDTIFIPNNLDRYVSNKEELESFITYINTQAGGVKKLKQRNDTWLVMQCIRNLMIMHDCNWITYYNNPSINHSQSIKRLKNNSYYYNKKCYRDNPRFKILKRKAIMTLLNIVPEEFTIPNGVRTFESCKKSPNKGVHLLNKIYRPSFKSNMRVYYYNRT